MFTNIQSIHTKSVQTKKQERVKKYERDKKKNSTFMKVCLAKSINFVSNYCYVLYKNEQHFTEQKRKGLK